MKTKITMLLALCISVISVNAQMAETVKVPAEVKPFVEKGTRAIALESADLNSDGMKDYILVLEREMPEDEAEDYPKDQRPLLILVRDKNKKLSEAKRNERMVMCSQCGGIYGDPFAGVTVGKNTFTVNHYGGSAWRWSEDYKFNYSRIDKTWQLVKIEKTSYHNVRPMKETLEKTVLTPPKDYGKVDVADFDPEDYRENPDEDSETASDKLITIDSVGKVKIGMTVAETRKALKGFTLERTSDGEGIALIGAREGEREYAMTFYAGEVDPEAKINENAKIELIEVWYADYKTADGVHPRMEISDVEKKYGKLKEITMSEIESREYAKFANQPKGIEFRVLGENADAGKYKQGERKTVSYTPKAYLHSILIYGLDGVESEGMADTFEKLDVGDYNKMIKKAAASNEAWVKMPMFVIANLLEPFFEMKSRNIEMVSKFADVTDDLTVIVTDDGYADDSVRGAQYKFNLKLNEQGVWQVISAEKAHRCREGRGHQDYSTAPCL